MGISAKFLLFNAQLNILTIFNNVACLVLDVVIKSF